MRQPIPFGKYLLLDRVSVGGMAEVFKAKSYGVEGFEKVIAIKRILPSMGEDRDFIKMFIDEAKIAGQLSHANICQIFELGRIDGAHFIAMEYIWGKDLLQLQNRFKKLDQLMPVNMACFIISKVCEGLDYAHRKKDALGRPLQIVHRDCSPQNVLISFEGEVKVIDFGIAKAASRSSRTMAGVLKGKFGYMSPEQVRGLPLDRRSDIFALGTILYESLTGERLFVGESDFSTLERVRNVDIQPPRTLNRNIPPEVEAVVMRALTKDPEERYQWCGEMRADLQQYLMAQPEVFTAKSLAGWLRTGFDAELAHEHRLMEQYKQLGRDGLIQGMPAAEAKLDVVQYLGEAGVSDDPTVLGGPSFEDMLDDPISDEPLPLKRAAGRQRTSNEFGDEAPTELFGEVGGDEEPLTYDRLEPVGAPAPAVQVADLNAEVPILGVHAAAQAAEAVRAVQIAQAATISPSSGIMAPDISSLGLPHAVPSFTPPGMYGTDPGYFGSTSNVTPLPSPVSDLDRLRANKQKRRPSVFKDVGIGIGIAALVLGLFAGGKYLFFGDTPGTKEARGGTIAVALPGNEIAAEVWIDDEKVGVVEGDEPLTLDERPAGTYHVKVTRPGVQDCEKKIEVESGKPSIVTCTFVKEPETGLLVIEGLASDHTVFFDGQQISDEAAREPLKLSPGHEHSIVIKRGDEIIKELRPTGVAGRELRRVIVETSRASAETSVAAADATPREPVRTDEPRAAPRPAVTSRDDDQEPKPTRAAKPKTVDIGKRAPGDKPGTAPGADDADDQYGYLIANTTPWARVWIDGKDTGRSTPIARRSRIKLEPGKHKVVFVVGNQKFPFSVVITAGETSKLVKDLAVKE